MCLNPGQANADFGPKSVLPPVERTKRSDVHWLIELGSKRWKRFRKSQRKIMSFRSSLAATAMLFSVMSASAYSIDYVGTEISPASTFNGGSGNFTVTNPLQPGSQISFTLTVKINTQGNTTPYPATASFSATSTPEGAVVSAIPSCTFADSGTTCANTVTITAPNTAGAYQVKLSSDGTDPKGGGGLGGGNGIVINFTVATPPPVEIVQILPTLSVSIGTPCLVLHAQNTSLTATLLANGTPLVGKTVTFTLAATTTGETSNATGVTNEYGVATASINTGIF